MSLTEGEVYLGAKRLLQNHGWTVLAGQPPSGLNHLPAVEIKWEGREGIGSEGALRPDLIAADAPRLLLVECKPRHSNADAQKLRSVLGDPERIDALLSELAQRRLFDRAGLPRDPERWEGGIFGALAHSGPVRRQDDLWIISVRGRDGGGELLKPTSLP